MKRLDLSCIHLSTPQPGTELVFSENVVRGMDGWMVDGWVDAWMGKKFSGWLDGMVEETEVDRWERRGWMETLMN